MWLSPHPTHAAEARQVIRSLGSGVQATVLHAIADAWPTALGSHSQTVGIPAPGYPGE